MRALALLFGSLLICNSAALAANTPSSVDVQTVDPGGGDLFTPRPADPAPVAAAPVAMTPASVPAVAAATAAPVAHVASGNPLWSIPMARLSATRDQPLFAPSRRPAPRPELVARPAPPVVVAPPPPPEPERPQLSLLGTVAGSGERIGLFIDSASKAVLRLKRGENHQGWTLRDVRPRQVELAKGLDNTVLEMPTPDMQPGPPAALAASPPPPPAALVVGAKAASGPPTLTNPNVPRGPQPAQPANFVNPFAQQRPR